MASPSTARLGGRDARSTPTSEPCSILRYRPRPGSRKTGARVQRPRRRKRCRRRAAVVKASAAARFLVARSRVRMRGLLHAKASVPAAQVATESSSPSRLWNATKLSPESFSRSRRASRHRAGVAKNRADPEPALTCPASYSGVTPFRTEGTPAWTGIIGAMTALSCPRTSSAPSENLAT